MVYHKFVQIVLGYGYGETVGEDAVVETFQAFLRCRDKNESKLSAADENDFLHFFLDQHEGVVPGESEDEDDPEPQGVS